jgi:hypothetical protein
LWKLLRNTGSTATGNNQTCPLFPRAINDDGSLSGGGVTLKNK